MRELVEKDRLITVVPHDFRHANKGVIKDVSAGEFVVELDYEPTGMLEHNYCEFYTQTQHGTLYFEAFPKKIDGKSITVVSPAKHKFLQRRQYTRIRFIENLDLAQENKTHKIQTLDISAGGMKFTTNENIDIELEYRIKLPLSEIQTVECLFSPIRIEKNNNGGYTVSGRFNYLSNVDKMTLIQYCAKRSIEIRNK